MKPTFGLEEEVFIVEPTKPSIQSLYYLSKLVWKQPRRYILHTDSNFSRNKDILQGLMSGVEISTFIHQNAKQLIEDLKGRREELIGVSEGLIVCLGHLINYNAPTNICALQFHVGNLSDPKRVYNNLIHYAPLLFLLAANSPAVDSRYYGKSWRLLNSYAVGEIKSDWKDRFQDIIYAKRTDTIELRLFDPVWDIQRIEILANAIEAIVSLDFEHKIDIKEYNRLRKKVALDGYCEELESRYVQLSQICDIDKEYFLISPADIIWAHFEKHGLEDTYVALDSGYKTGKLEIRPYNRPKKSAVKMLTGFAAYYVPKIPYDIWKYVKEH